MFISSEATSMASEIEIDGVSKSFGAVRAVDRLSLNVEPGELFGLIGPDGAGKTTLIRVLVGLMLAESGAARVGGMDIVARREAVKEIIGYMPQKFSLYQDLTVEENLRFYGDLFQFFGPAREARHEELLRFSRLGEFRGRRAGALSGGMKQKLALSCALIHTPRALFLDEPTTGVDPVSRREFWDLLDRLKKEGVTILVTTAYMDEAARCDRVGLMYEGRLLAVDSPGTLPGIFPHDLLEIILEEPVRRVGLVRGIEGVRSVQVFGDKLHVAVLSAEKSAELIRESLEHAGAAVRSISRVRPTVEDVFVELIREQEESKQAREGGRDER
jgi:ABC-2 type transport system ATP-binding protein